MSKIAFIKSDHRYYNIERSLSLIKSEVMAGLRNARNIVIKVSCPNDTFRPTATHAEALDAVLTFITPYTERQVMVAEGTATGETLKAFKNFGYLEIQNKHGFAIADLNTDEYVNIELLDSRGKPWQAKLAKTLIEADYLISLSPPKIHPKLLFAGAIENCATGGLHREGGGNPLKGILHRHLLGNDHKAKIFSDKKTTKENMLRLYDRVSAHLSILDAYEIAEGNNQSEGSVIPAHSAFCSSDPVALDGFACQFIGIPTKKVSYLAPLTAISEEHVIIGDRWEACAFQAKLPQPLSHGRKK